MSKVLMPSELKSSKKFIGKFKVITKAKCDNCNGRGFIDHSGDLEDKTDWCPCGYCHEKGVIDVDYKIPLKTIKDIYAMAVKHLGEEVSKTPGLFIQGDTYQGDDK